MGVGGLNACQDGLGHPYIWVEMREEVPQSACLGNRPCNFFSGASLIQPKFCLAVGLFSPQASLASLRLAAAALLVGIRQDETKRTSMVIMLEMVLEEEVVRSTMLVASLSPFYWDSLIGHCKVNSKA